MSEWIETAKELPPCNGWYKLSNSPELNFVVPAIAYYDGVGFVVQSIYMPYLYWTDYKDIPKNYGKKDDQSTG